jgi:hypothetical protein
MEYDARMRATWVVRPAAVALGVPLALGLSACGGRSAGPAAAEPEAGLVDAGHDSAPAPSDAQAEPDIEASAEAGIVSCSSPHDCPMHFGPQVYCCTGNVCGTDEPTACPDGGERPIVASNYDQTCSTDEDCTPIAEGNACSLIGPCSTAVISKTSLPRYQADIVGVPCYGLAGCPAETPPCCRAGTCQTGAACNAPSDTLPACADAGGSCVAFVIECGSQGAGPPDACAYADEMCCLLQ